MGFASPESDVPAAVDVPNGIFPPRPLESLQSAPVPPFLTKTYDLVEDGSLDSVISWSPGGKSFVVWDPVRFSRSVLPRHFKHGNFSSFIRQLNTYFVCLKDSWRRKTRTVYRYQGFRKIDTERWEFANEDFLQGQRHLLRNIRRRRSSQAQQPGHSGTCTELEKTDMEAQVEVLKGDKDALMQEVRKLNEQQQLAKTHIKALNHRLKATEERQKQILTFLGKAFVNPKLLTHLFLRQKDRKLPCQRRNRLPISQQMNKTSLDSCMERKLVEYKFEDSSSSLELSDLELIAGVDFSESAVMVPKDGLGADGEARQGSNPLLKKEHANKYDITALPTFESDISSLKGKSVMNNDADRSDYGADYLVSTPEDASMEAIFGSLTQNSNVLVFNQNEMLDDSVISVEGCASSDILCMNAIDLHTEGLDIAELWGVNVKQNLDVSPINLWPSDLDEHQNLPVHSENQLGGSDMVADAKVVDLSGVGKRSC